MVPFPGGCGTWDVAGPGRLPATALATRSVGNHSGEAWEGAGRRERALVQHSPGPRGGAQLLPEPHSLRQSGEGGSVLAGGNSTLLPWGVCREVLALVPP